MNTKHLPGNPFAEYAAYQENTAAATLALAYEVRTLTLSLTHQSSVKMLDSCEDVPKEIIEELGRQGADVDARLGGTKGSES